MDATEALVLLRAHPFACGLTVGQAAWAIVERHVALDLRDWQEPYDKGLAR